jgi:serine/threonine protein kinase
MKHGLRPSLQIDPDNTGSATWSIREDGTMHHKQTGVTIGTSGVSDTNAQLRLNPADVQFDSKNVLGRGAGGSVVRATHVPTGNPLALKVVKLDDKGKRDQLINDIVALQTANSGPYLVKFYGAYIDAKSGCVHVALEFMDLGSLNDLCKLQQRAGISPKVPEAILSLMTIQMLKGLEYLHANHCLHRDIKPHNVLMNSEGAVKLSDFGISKNLNNTMGICDTFVGTSIYMSPERIMGKDYSYPADIWSMGVLVYELAAGQHPFPVISSFPVLFDILLNQPEPRLKESEYSSELCDFVASCLQRDPSKRPPVSELIQHPFVQKTAYDRRLQEFREWLQMVKEAAAAKTAALSPTS